MIAQDVCAEAMQAEAEGLVLERSSDSATGFKGVRQSPGSHKFEARISMHGELELLGLFATAEQAALAYARRRAKAARRLKAPPPDRPSSPPLSAEEVQQQAEAEGLVLERSFSTSGFKGVYPNHGARSFFAQIYLNGSNENLGQFATAEQAALAYARRAKTRPNPRPQVSLTAPPLSVEEVQQQAEAEGLVLERSSSTSGFRGVYPNHGARSFFAQICLNGNNENLGHFATAEQAALAYARRRAKAAPDAKAPPPDRPSSPPLRAEAVQQQAEAEGLELERSSNSSGFKGVRQQPGSHKFTARISMHGEQELLGPFATAEQAALAYARRGKAARRLEAPPPDRPSSPPLRAEEVQQQAEAEGLVLERSSNSSGFKGVYVNQGTHTFFAQFYLNGSNENLGQFATAEQAALAYARRAKQVSRQPRLPTGHATAPLAPGDHVKARFMGGAKWYTGRVSLVHPDGRCDLQYDDGDLEDRAHPSRIRKIGPERPSAGSGQPKQPPDGQLVEFTGSWLQVHLCGTYGCTLPNNHGGLHRFDALGVRERKRPVAFVAEPSVRDPVPTPMQPPLLTYHAAPAHAAPAHAAPAHAAAAHASAGRSAASAAAASSTATGSTSNSKGSTSNSKGSTSNSKGSTSKASGSTGSPTAAPSQPTPAGQLPRVFWRAGDYSSTTADPEPPSRDGLTRARTHPKFLHSNATTHTWPLGAIAELIDNSYDEMRTVPQLDPNRRPRLSWTQTGGLASAGLKPAASPQLDSKWRVRLSWTQTGGLASAVSASRPPRPSTTTRVTEGHAPDIGCPFYGRSHRSTSGSTSSRARQSIGGQCSPSETTAAGWDAPRSTGCSLLGSRQVRTRGSAATATASSHRA